LLTNGQLSSRSNTPSPSLSSCVTSPPTPPSEGRPGAVPKSLSDLHPASDSNAATSTIKGQFSFFSFITNSLYCSLGDYVEFDTTVALAAFVGVVAADRLGFSIAAGGQLIGLNAQVDQVVADGIGTLLRQLLVVGFGTDAVGVAGKLH